MAAPKARGNSPRGQRPPAKIHRFVELSLRAGASKAVFTAQRRLSEGAGSVLWREFGRRVIAGERIGVRRLQIPRQQLVNTVDRVIGDSLEYRADKRLGVVAVEFGTAQQAVDRRRSLTAGIAAGK